MAGTGERGSEQHAGTRSLTAADLLSAIGKEFAAKRKQDKVAAWMFLQNALMENIGTLCPAVVSLKDIIAATANVEDLLKGQTSETGETPTEYLERYLTATDDKTVKQ